MTAQNALLEIGVEHLPARFVTPAISQLKTLAENLLAQNRLPFERVETFGTYRRLVVFIHGLAEKSEDIQKAVKGPPAKLLKDAHGNFTPQAAGFAQKNGLRPEKLTIQETDKGPFLYAQVHIKGTKTTALLPDLFTRLVIGLEFAKNMVWEDSGLHYGRPVRSLVGLYGTKVIKFTVAGVTAGRVTHGMLSYGNEPLKVTSADKEGYVRLLRNQNPPILVLPHDRREALIKSVTAQANARGYRADLDEKLIDQTVAFTEHPVALCGEMDLKALTLPRNLITTVLKEQLKMFPVVNEKNELQPYFIAVRDGSSANQAEVTDGFKKVMSARLSDAVFFFENDKKEGLNVFHERLKNRQFLEGVGSQLDKALRVEKLAQQIFTHLHPACAPQAVAYAALHCYDDLASHVVYEFPELQGYMGGQYAALEAQQPGASPWMKAAAKAMEEVYWPLTSTSLLPGTVEGNIVSLSDKLDTLAGNFLIGQIPTGSEDPFALRRQAFAVVRILLENKWPLTVAQLLHTLNGVYENRLSGPVLRQLSDFLYQRLSVVLEERGQIPALLQASIHWDLMPLTDVEQLLLALRTVLERPAFVAAVAAAKRVQNILKKFPPVNTAVAETLLESPAERTLLHLAQNFVTQKAHTQAEFMKALETLEVFAQPLEEFFTQVMVNVPDEKIRTNRLALLTSVRAKLTALADITAL